MQIFISEFLTSGAWVGQVSDSLVEEGRAMLLAFAEDAARIPSVHLTTTWDVRSGRFPLNGVDVCVVNSPDDEATTFQQLAEESDAVFVIAPETNNLLLDRYDLVHTANGRWMGAARTIIERCSDKRLTAQLLIDAGVPTIPTTRLDKLPADQLYPIVVKPRDGAGADETFVIGSRHELASLYLSRSRECYVAQPLIDGTAISCFCVASDDQPHVFPTAAQHIEMKHQVKYLGGHMPLNAEVRPEIRQLVIDGLKAIDARVGHFGFDMIDPHNGSPCQIVEINPRLTTSYLGYRRILRDNMAERILFPQRFASSVECRGRAIHFDTRGNTRLSNTPIEAL